MFDLARFVVFTLFLIFVSTLLGCGTPASNPCQIKNHCVSDSASGGSKCETGYVWEDSSDDSNYHCVPAGGTDGGSVDAGGGTGTVDGGSGTSTGGTVDGGSGTSTGGTVDGGSGTTGGTTGAPLAPDVDPDCRAGHYSEEIPNVNANIAPEINGFSSANYQNFIFDVLDKRYPVGAWLTELGQKNQQIGDCIEIFIGPGKTSASQAISRMSTIVHECGHFADISAGGFSSSSYLITPTLTLSCNNGNSTQQSGSTFARSLILNDQWSVAHPACSGGSFQGCDSYANVYLDGDPNNATFEGGDQGFSVLFEEVVQYVNSLVTGYAFADQGSQFSSASDRDGILNFLWYVERYLHMARTQYPKAYSTITEPCWRNAILTVWGRAWLYLELTKGMSKLGIEDAKLLNLMRTPELLEEIQKLRDLEGY